MSCKVHPAQPGWLNLQPRNSMSARQPSGSCRPRCCCSTLPLLVDAAAAAGAASTAAAASGVSVPSACCIACMARLMAPAALATSPTVLVRLPSEKAKLKLLAGKQGAANGCPDHWTADR